MNEHGHGTDRKTLRGMSKHGVYDHLAKAHGRTLRYSQEVYSVGWLRDMHIDEHAKTEAQP